MHELGVLLEVVDQVSNVAKENDVTEVEKLVIEVGELCSMIPKYMYDLYPMAIMDSVLEGSELEIEVIPGVGKCSKCSTEYNLLENEGYCPQCKAMSFNVISGEEFIIKEILCK